MSPERRPSYRKVSVQAAYCGMTVGLSVVVMLMGGLIPIAVYAVPLICGLLLLPVTIEFGKPSAWATFAATALLALILDFDKEAAFFYLFVSYYPILKWSIDRIRSKPVRLITKLLLFSVSVTVMYLLLWLLFPMEAFMQEFHELGTAMLFALLAVFDICMLMYDRLLFFALMIYANRIKPKLKFLR